MEYNSDFFSEKGNDNSLILSNDNNFQQLDFKTELKELTIWYGNQWKFRRSWLKPFKTSCKSKDVLMLHD